MVTDDFPWPELGNVSRGATRGNQGHKGFLSSPDHEGRCILQLRVQPGVLTVRLNRQSSDWYRILDGEVTRALKLTRTYWRKARRRQDYDARADQDHMELHEWLQQLKDKTMSHLEVLMQKGDINGPPYVMPDDMELSFLRQFIERHNAGIPHNPRLRQTMGNTSLMPRNVEVESIRSETSDYDDYPLLSNVADHERDAREDISDCSSSKMVISSTSISSSPRNLESVMHEANTSRQALLGARASLVRAQKATQEAFLTYTTCLETEHQARLDVSAAEKRRDDIMAALLAQSSNSSAAPSRPSSESADEHFSPPIRHAELDQGHRRAFNGDQQSDFFLPKYSTHAVQDLRSRSESMRSSEQIGHTADDDRHGDYSDESSNRAEDSSRLHRKHSRNWDRGSQLQDVQYTCEDSAAMQPRKRIHHVMGGFDMLSNVALQSQTMTLSS